MLLLFQALQGFLLPSDLSQYYGSCSFSEFPAQGYFPKAQLNLQCYIVLLWYPVQQYLGERA